MLVIEYFYLVESILLFAVEYGFRPIVSYAYLYKSIFLHVTLYTVKIRKQNYFSIKMYMSLNRATLKNIYYQDYNTMPKNCHLPVS